MQLRSMIVLAGLFIPALAAADASVSRDDFMKYMETQLALKDPRILKMPENVRIQRIASVNFSMRGPQLQEVLDRVEAAGGPDGLAKSNEASVRAALESLPFGERIKEVRVDTESGHVVTYVKWETKPEFYDEAVWVALKVAESSVITSTVHLTAIDDGEDIWRAKLASDRTKHVREDRIGDWAKTRYLRLFEVDYDATRSKGRGSRAAGSESTAP